MQPAISNEATDQGHHPMTTTTITPERMAELRAMLSRTVHDPVVMRDELDALLTLAARAEAYEEALRTIIEVDKTRYEHHEPRPDGTLPRVDGGTCWLTPKQKAIAALASQGSR
jgi:hypothetical protein